MKRLIILLLLLPAFLQSQNLRRWGSSGATSTLQGNWFYNSHPAYTLADSLKLVDFRLLKDTAAALRAGGVGMSIGGTVTSGTAGSVLFLGSGGALRQDNSNFFYDSTNKRLGIGTNSPVYRLDVFRAATGQTATTRTLNVSTTGSTFNTTSAAYSNHAGYFSADATVSTGGYALTNIGVMGHATGGDNNFGIATSNSTYTGFGKFYQSANNTTKVEGGPATDNIQWGPDNRIRINTPNVICSGSLSAGAANSDDAIGALQAWGKLTIHTADSGSSPINMLYLDGIEVKKAAVPSGGIASINSQSGSSQTLAGGAGLVVNSSSNVHTVNLITTLDAQVSDANNTGTSATDLYSKTIAANQCTLNGQSIHFEAAGTNNDATATVNLEALFAGNGIAGTGAITISATGVWSIQGTIIRATSTTARVYTVVTIDNCTQKVFSTTANLTGLDWTTTNVLKIRATAGGGGGGSNDITAQMWKVVFQP